MWSAKPIGNNIGNTVEAEKMHCSLQCMCHNANTVHMAQQILDNGLLKIN